MYTVTIDNGGTITTINEDTVKNTSARIKGGRISEEINSIPSFSFTIYPNNPGYDLLEGLYTKIKVYNSKTQKYDFEGRVLTVSDSMDASGLICKSVVCEGLLGHLCDSVQPYAENHNVSVRTFLGYLLSAHNSQSDFKVYAGAVTVKDSNDSLYRYRNYETTLEDIKSKLIDTLGGEIQLRYNSDEGKYYLDYLDQIGTKSTTNIELSVNLKSITREVDPTSVITRLYPLGAKESDSERRLTIASVNGNKTYIDNDSLIAKYGVISGAQTWDDVTLASNLLVKGKAFLAAQNKALKKYQITALDLSLIKLDFEQFALGNTHRVKNPLMGIDEDLRIIGRVIDLDSPQNSSLTFGDKFETLTNLTAKKNRQLKTVIEDNQFRNMTVINDKIENATQLITGAQGGHVILDPSEKPSRILIMDTDNIDTCTSCIQFNKNGMGFWRKSDGGSAKTGPYKNAWTIDGNLVAEFITALTLTGLKINNGNGTFKVDEDGNVTLKSVQITNGMINCGNGKFKVDSAGNVIMTSANITNGNINCGSGKFKVDSAGNVTMSSANITNGNISCGSGKFKVDENGTLIATNATFSDENGNYTFKVYPNGIRFSSKGAQYAEIYSTGSQIYISADDYVITKNPGDTQRYSLRDILKNGGLI